MRQGPISEVHRNEISVPKAFEKYEVAEIDEVIILTEMTINLSDGLDKFREELAEDIQILTDMEAYPYCCLFKDEKGFPVAIWEPIGSKKDLEKFKGPADFLNPERFLENFEVCLKRVKAGEELFIIVEGIYLFACFRSYHRDSLSSQIGYDIEQSMLLTAQDIREILGSLPKYNYNQGIYRLRKQPFDSFTS